jgi:DNA polymerase-3 subunit alpha
MQEADTTRKAVGKKLTEVMAEVEKKFIESSVKRGHDENLAKTIFSWIDKFSGYGFNKSHAVSYAFLGYWGAYAKVHFPLEFFKNKLAFSDSNPDEFDEIKQLVHEAKLFDIKITPPSIDEMNVEFKYSGEEAIMFGLAHIKGVGQSSLKEVKKLGKIDSENDLFHKIFVDKIKVKKNVVEALVKSGAIPMLRQSRVRTLARYMFLQQLTDRERNHLYDEGFMLSEPTITCMISILESSGIMRGDKRIIKIKAGFEGIKAALGGNPVKMALAWEKFHLGMPLTGSEVDLYSNHRVDTTCRDFLKIRNKSSVCMGVIIESVKTIKDKKGNQMCFLSLSDSTYMIDSAVVFSRAYKDCSWIIEVGKPVLISGRKDNTSLFVNKIEHL